MKTTFELPDAVGVRAKSEAMKRGISLQDFVVEVLKDKLMKAGEVPDKPWMAAFGKLRHLHKETDRINQLIEEEFEQAGADAAGH